MKVAVPCTHMSKKEWSLTHFPIHPFSAEVDTSEARKEEIAKLEHLGPVVDSVIKISDDLETIEKLQKKIRLREVIGRSGMFLCKVETLLYTSTDMLLFLYLCVLRICYRIYISIVSGILLTDPLLWVRFKTFTL